MKTIKQFGLVLVLAVSTILSSCSSSDGDGGGGGSAAAGTIKAKAGSTNFTSMTAATFAMQQGGMLIIQGSDASGKAIQLMLTGVTAAGTYEISDTAGISVIGSYTEVNLNTMSSTTWAAPFEGSGNVGSITISEITATTVKGNFTFTGKNQNGSDNKNVTNGAFNVNFQGN
ncbi:DUF6252 family protein [Flavobacterium wongokense]|uniref:DUF6252 family protein n=1 Tax=Flavobacterium wongokense TaxID=2910674 RepID=UPI001F284CEB|nr:DUF6252 family protein [Flavobacterium sp. WG47]MCF6130866.1 DUF6252 family protein [Flavobacterium sp. WG47]